MRQSRIIPAFGMRSGRVEWRSFTDSFLRRLLRSRTARFSVAPAYHLSRGQLIEQKPYLHMAAFWIIEFYVPVREQFLMLIGSKY